MQIEAVAVRTPETVSVALPCWVAEESVPLAQGVVQKNKTMFHRLKSRKNLFLDLLGGVVSVQHYKATTGLRAQREPCI